MIGPGDLERMDSVLAGLGPDNCGRWFGGSIGLGCRLMRFTHEDLFETQPLPSVDRNKILVCDARIDNRLELAAALGIPAAVTHSLPDSAFIMQAWERWGEDCVEHLVGDYSLALWDDSQQKLTLARSALGGRPLFYYSSSGLFAFSSVPKGLFALPAIPRRLNLERIADYLVQAPIEPGTSFFLDICRLHAGHILTVSTGMVRVRKFWRPELTRNIRFARDEEYVDAFNEVFERVISDHIRSSSSVGVMMSGGLDSSSVAAVAASQFKRQGKCLATFTEVPPAGFDGNIFNGRYADETPYVQAMSHRYDAIDLHLVRTDGQTYLDGLDRFFATANMPFRNASNRVWYEAILQQARNQGVHVLLTGAQGNLTISRNGYDLLQLLLRKGHWVRALREARALGNGAALRTLVGQGVMPMLPNSLFTAVQTMRGKSNRAAGQPPWQAYSVINPDFAKSQRVAERAREKGCNFLSRTSYDMRSTYAKILPGLTMTTNDINHAYRELYGVDVRDPTADNRIFEFCHALPEEQFLKDGVSRRLIRRAMADKLPAEILSNRLRGLQAADWFERLLASREKFLREVIQWHKSELVSHVLDLKRLGDLLEQIKNVREHTPQVMMEYRQAMEFGIMTGRFIWWFENEMVMHA